MVKAPPVPGKEIALFKAAAAEPAFRAAAETPVIVRVPPPETYHSPETIGPAIPNSFSLVLTLNTNAPTMTLLLSTNLSSPWESSVTLEGDTNGITIIDTDFLLNPQRFFYLRPNL